MDMSKINEMSVKRSFDVADFKVSDENEGRVEGHAAVFEQKTNIGDWFYEVIERGAFDGCDFDDVLLFINHNTRKIPLARSRRNNGNSTMQLKVDDQGLFIGATLDIQNNQEASALHSAISRHDIEGMSFSFKIAEQRWIDLDTDMPTRYIEKIAKVFEVSAVNHPAYDGTEINARDREALENAKKTLDNVRSKELENSEALEIEKLRTKIILNGGI